MEGVPPHPPHSQPRLQRSRYGARRCWVRRCAHGRVRTHQEGRPPAARVGRWQGGDKARSAPRGAKQRQAGQGDAAGAARWQGHHITQQSGAHPPGVRVIPRRAAQCGARPNKDAQRVARARGWLAGLVRALGPDAPPRAPRARRKLGGPTRRSSKGGWTPQEVRPWRSACCLLAPTTSVVRD